MTGPATPTALAKLPLGRAEEIAADTAQGVRPTAKMRGMGMASMPGMGMTAPGASPGPSALHQAGVRLVKTVAVVLPLAELLLFLAWRRSRTVRPRLPRSHVVRFVRT
jgi:hypothetical protein